MHRVEAPEVIPLDRAARMEPFVGRPVIGLLEDLERADTHLVQPLQLFDGHGRGVDVAASKLPSKVPDGPSSQPSVAERSVPECSSAAQQLPEKTSPTVRSQSPVRFALSEAASSRVPETAPNGTIGGAEQVPLIAFPSSDTVPSRAESRADQADPSQKRVNKYVRLAQGINCFSTCSGQILDKDFESKEYEQLATKPASAISGVSE